MLKTINQAGKFLLMSLALIVAMVRSLPTTYHRPWQTIDHRTDLMIDTRNLST